MADTIHLPRRIRQLALTWTELAPLVASAAANPLPPEHDVLTHEDLTRFKACTRQHLACITTWIEQLDAWINGPLTAALADTDTSDEAMRDVAGQLAGFVDTLKNQRGNLATQSQIRAMQGAAFRIDRLYVSLLLQLHTFVIRVTGALTPTALARASTQQQQSPEIALSFSFRPDLDHALADFQAWQSRVHNRLAAGVATPSPPLAADEPIGLLTLLILLPLAAGMLWLVLNYGVILFIGALLIAAIIFVWRHPLLTLLALLIGLN
ncbi:MAG TPA: hypothetical protein VFN09_01935 [Rhodanobacteraceae bacterium]|nr:hypothetical protein [Rhodanobacteraceae bacterium]